MVKINIKKHRKDIALIGMIKKMRLVAISIRKLVFFGTFFTHWTHIFNIIVLILSINSHILKKKENKSSFKLFYISPYQNKQIPILTPKLFSLEWVLAKNFVGKTSAIAVTQYSSLTLHRQFYNQLVIKRHRFCNGEGRARPRSEY